MERTHTISSSLDRALHAERRQRWLSPLRALASLGLLSLVACLPFVGDTTPSFTVAPMLVIMLVVPLLLRLPMAGQAAVGLAIAATYLLGADWSHAGMAEALATVATAASGVLLSIVTAAYVEDRAASRGARACAPMLDADLARSASRHAPLLVP